MARSHPGLQGLDSPLPVFHPYHKFVFIVILTPPDVRHNFQIRVVGRVWVLIFEKQAHNLKSTYENLFGLFGDMSPNHSEFAKNIIF